MKKSENKQPMKVYTVITGIFTIIIVIVAIFVYISVYNAKETNIMIKDNNSKIQSSRNEMIKRYMYNVIPEFTYEYYGDQHLYLNIIYNNDNSIDIYGL